jgi:serine/threonine-protein phosphatase PGAM5
VARTRLYLVRHGEQDPTTGHAPTGGLSPRGRDQADKLGRRLAAVPFTRILHSPLARAVETTDIVATHLPGVPRHADDLVKDRTPVPSPEHLSDYPAIWHDWLASVPADDRDVDAHTLRQAVDELGVTGDSDRNELVITHNFVVGWFARHALDAPVWRWITLISDNCGLTVVEWRDDRPAALVAFNDTGHL